MNKTLKAICIALCAIAAQTSYFTGHVSNLGALCSTIEETQGAVG